MGRKPSLTKQIADELGTEDKREQLEMVKRLKSVANAIPVAVTVLSTAAGIDVAVASPAQVSADEVRGLLNEGVDHITAAIVRARLQQLQKEEADADEPLNDSEVPDSVLQEPQEPA
jgi:hypothetical protein